MRTHGAGGTRRRAVATAEGTTSSTTADSPSGRRSRLSLAVWPVARRLFAVIVAALLMGVIFGGLRVADSEASASQFSQVSQVATLGAKLTVLVDALQNERDQTLLLLSGNQVEKG